MARILIAAGDVVTAQGIQGALESRGHQTATIWEAMEVIDFCSKHVPDLIVMDMRLNEGRSWTAIQTMRQTPALAPIPVFGLSTQITELEIEHAKALRFVGLEFIPSNAEDLIPLFDNAIAIATQANVAPQQATATPAPQPEAAAAPAPQLQSVPGGNSAESTSSTGVGQLQIMISEIRQLADALAPFTAQFGSDGAELFAFIDGSTNEITAKLKGYTDQGFEHASLVLQDRDVRHDFRNMIGSVTGFSELILMESGIPEKQRQQFTQIRKNCSAFVDLLDQQKEVAAAA